MVAELQAFLDEIDAGRSGGAALPELQQLPEVAAKLAVDVCLMCGKTVVKPEPYTRGLCRSDYLETLGNLKADIWIEEERMAAGLLARIRKPGKKKKARAPEPDAPGKKKKAVPLHKLAEPNQPGAMEDLTKEQAKNES